ncbi:MAG: hypothetical protein F6K54_08845 [Okeania sp. SIO3B5]|uniref:hypothetical protein n=1 Tax=Okeania sp. SIO3B5 TaxID=2607811 RepID=UPI0013FEEFB4|nr:hypothetical protein [Okeania sp. SIO3B5]NEO53178.1 hypothetical protein [Okeania sp. SIO3B5]
MNKKIQARIYSLVLRELNYDSTYDTSDALWYFFSRSGISPSSIFFAFLCMGTTFIEEI